MISVTKISTLFQSNRDKKTCLSLLRGGNKNESDKGYRNLHQEFPNKKPRVEMSLRDKTAETETENQMQ